MGMEGKGSKKATERGTRKENQEHRNPGRGRRTMVERRARQTGRMQVTHGKNKNWEGVNGSDKSASLDKEGRKGHREQSKIMKRRWKDMIVTCPFSFGMLPLIIVGEFGTKRLYLGKNRKLLRSTIACKSGTVTLGHTVQVLWNDDFPIDIFALLVGVEVCKGVLDYVSENYLLQVHHLAMKI